MLKVYFCSECRVKACVHGGAYPDGCPSALAEAAVSAAINHIHGDAETRRVLAAATGISRDEEGALRTRIEELIAFAHQLECTRLGVAFCVSMAREANRLCTLLADAGFQVVPVCCTVGRISLEAMGIVTQDDAPTTACNPVAQAHILNAQATDLNILLGLCVGHDALFTHHATSLTTTLVVKDRALKHNAVEALRGVAEVGASR